MRTLVILFLINCFNIYSSLLPESLWKIRYESSFQPEHSAVNIIDGDTTTYWHSALTPQKTEPPHEIQIDLGAQARFTALVLSPRKNNTAGRCAQCDISISDDGENWQLLKSTLLFWHQNNDFSDKTIHFDTPVTARYLRYRHLQTFDNGMSDPSVGTLSGLAIKGEYSEPVVAAGFSLDENPPYLVIGEEIKVKNTSIAYHSTLQSVKWHCPGAELSVDDEGNAILVYRKSGFYTLSLEVTNNMGFTSVHKHTRPINILPGPYINRRNWIITDFSEECPAYEAYARHTIDSIPKTRWLTSWDQLKTLPHYLVYDMGDNYHIQGFGYLPSQYTNDEGAVTKWKIFVSNDTKNWGNPVGQGSWTYDNAEIKYEQLTKTTGRYVKFQIDKSLPDGKNYANCAEFYLYGSPARPGYRSYLPGAGAVIVLLALLFWYRRKKTATPAMPTLEREFVISNQPKTNETYIYLFGDFTILHKGDDSTANFYPKIKQLFALLLLHSGGISIHKLTDLLWPGMPADKASSNRGTNMQNLKKALSGIEGIRLHYAGKQWHVKLSSSVYCDYIAYKKLYTRLWQQVELTHLETLCELLERGAFLKNMDTECFDELKEKTTEEVTSLLAHAASSSEAAVSAEVRSRIADCLLQFDELSEIGLELKLKSLIAQNKQSIAKLCFDNFCKRYKLLYGTEYTRKFSTFQ